MGRYFRSLPLVSALFLSIIGWMVPSALEGKTPEPDISAVDLSRVPLSPAELPASGFQLRLASELNLKGFVYRIVGDASADEFIGMQYASMRRGYLSQLVLHADRADPQSAQVASLGTIIAGWTPNGPALT